MIKLLAENNFLELTAWNECVSKEWVSISLLYNDNNFENCISVGDSGGDLVLSVRAWKQLAQYILDLNEDEFIERYKK